MVQQQMRAESELHRHERTQAERQLSDLRDQVRALQQDRVRAEALAQELRSRIAAMESSKFWETPAHAVSPQGSGWTNGGMSCGKTTRFGARRDES